MKKSCIAAALLLFLSGCGTPAQSQPDNSLAQLEYQFYPITEQYGITQPDAALLGSLQTDYNSITEIRKAQLEAVNQSNRTEPLNRVPEDRVLPPSRFSPLTKLLYAEDFTMKTNPVLVMRQVLSGTAETPVIESETAQHTEQIPLGELPAAQHARCEDLISACLQQYYYNMPYQIGFSEWENLYYVYLFDTREQLSVMALYFRFDDESRLTGIGADSMFYNPYEITVLEEGKYLPLPMPSEPTALPPLQHIREMALAALRSPLLKEPPAATSDKTECTHKQEVQYYYNKEASDTELLALRTMDWYLLEPDAPAQTVTEPVQTTAAETAPTTAASPETAPPSATLPPTPDPMQIVTELADQIAEELVSAVSEYLP